MGYGIGDSVLLSNGKSHKIVKIFSYQTEVENGKFIDNDYIIDNLISVYKHHNYTEEKNMNLKVGDLVAFKKYENMTDEEQAGISREKFPEFGKVEKVFNFTENIKIKGSSYIFPKKSIDYVIVKAATDDIHVGDEVLVKATVGEVKENYIWTSWISKDDVVEVLKRKEEHFIVQDDQYKMYVIDSKTLSLDKSKAKVYNSRNEANEVAADMHLNAWEVIPYDD